MPRRQTSLTNISDLAIARNIDSKYDAVKAVAGKLEEIELLAGIDTAAITAAINEALDFNGVTVDAYEGATANWDGTTKTLTLPLIKGAQGDQGDPGDPGLDGAPGVDGSNGLTPEIEFSVDINGNLQYEITYI